MAGLRTASAGKGRGPLVVAVRHGSRGVVGEFAPATPASGWDLASAKAAAMRWAVEHHTALQLDRERLGRSAFRALARALDEAHGRSAGHRESLVRADFADRLERRTS